MFYKLNKYTFVRNINNYLVIVDKRTENELIGDYTSYLFVRHLKHEAQDIDIIIRNVCAEFSGKVDFSLVKNDGISLFNRLSEFGLVSKADNTNSFINEDKEILNDIPRILLPKEELDKFKETRNKNPTLQSIIVEITKKCNERCIHCYIPHEDKTVMMSDEDFYRIVEQAKEMQTVVNFRISGGECMTHPSFKKFIKHVKENGFALDLLTNLTLLDDETIEILKNGTFSSVQTTLFSLKPEIHDRITTVPGSLEKTLKNLEKLNKAKIKVAIATQAMEMNKDSIDDLYRYCNSHGFNLRCDWTIIAKENRDENNLSCRICNLSDYKEICKLKLRYIDGYKNELKEELSRPPKSETTHLCNAGTNGLQIDTNLNVHPCPGWDLSLGNLKNETLSDIWMKSEKLQKVRDVILRDFPKCAKCEIRNLCSICMAQADLEMNSSQFKFEMPQYVCDMYKVIYDTIKEEVLEN